MNLTRFCWCCDLRNGAIFIGIIHNLIALPALVLSFLSFGYRHYITHLFKIQSTGNHIIPIISLVLIFCSFLKLCSCNLLISGAHRRSHLELMPWLVIEGIGLFASYIIILILTIIGLNLGIAWGIGTLAIGHLIIGISVYWWVCVCSLYRIYQKEDSNKFTDVERLIS